MTITPLRTPDRRSTRYRARTGMPALLLLLLLAGCASTRAVPTVHSSPTSSTVASVTPLPAATFVTLVSKPLSWQPAAMLPPAPRPAFVAPSDGSTAYLCQPSSDDQSGPTAQGVPAQVWRTSDRGAHWLRQTDVPVALDRNECQIVVDSFDPSVAVAVLAFRPQAGGAGGPDPTSYLDYATRDGGASWRLLPATTPYGMLQMATRQGVTYALREVPQGGPQTALLWSSTDGMTTWKPLGTKIGADLNTLWLNPANGALIVQSGGDQGKTLWKSTDGGLTFTQIRQNNEGFVAAIPTGAGDWTICGIDYDAAPTDEQIALRCSIDSGATWQIRSDATVAPIPVDSFVYWTQIFGIARDGSLLAILSQGDTPALYRLPAGASAWIALGSINPYATVLYSAGPDNGVIWQFASGASTTLVP